MSTYEEMIVEDTGCSSDDATKIEFIMREDVFHSTLDWQSRAAFRRGARKAAKLLEVDRDVYEAWFANLNAVFRRNTQPPPVTEE